MHVNIHQAILLALCLRTPTGSSAAFPCLHDEAVVLICWAICGPVVAVAVNNLRTGALVSQDIALLLCARLVFLIVALVYQTHAKGDFVEVRAHLGTATSCSCWTHLQATRNLVSCLDTQAVQRQGVFKNGQSLKEVCQERFTCLLLPQAWSLFTKQSDHTPRCSNEK